MASLLYAMFTIGRHCFLATMLYRSNTFSHHKWFVSSLPPLAGLCPQFLPLAGQRSRMHNTQRPKAAMGVGWGWVWEKCSNINLVLEGSKGVTKRPMYTHFRSSEDVGIYIYIYSHCEFGNPPHRKTKTKTKEKPFSNVLSLARLSCPPPKHEDRC